MPTTPHDEPITEAVRNRTALTFTWIVLVVAILWVGVGVATGAWGMAALSGVALVMNGIAVAAHRLGRPLLGRVLLLGNASVCFGALQYIVHPVAAVEINWVVAVGAPFLIFSPQTERRLLMGFVALPILTFLGVSAVAAVAPPTLLVTAEMAQGPVRFVTIATPLLLLVVEFSTFAWRTTQYSTRLRDARDQARRASAAKSNFLANVSHELRTPMNGVVGMLEVLGSTELDEEQREISRTIQDSTLALLRVVDDILDAAQIDAGRLTLSREPFTLRAAMQAVVDCLQVTASYNHVEMALELDPTLPDRVLGDRDRVIQVLRNLVDNAVKFSRRPADEPMGRVRLTARVAPGGGVIFEVVDDGIGISEPMQASLFQPFTQSESDSTRRFGGVGLGLSITSRLVDMMGGEIGVRSALGRGTTMTVRLPLMDAPDPHEPAPPTPPISEPRAPSPAPSPAGTAPSPAAPRLDGRSLLLVEDNLINQRVLVAMLEGLGAQVTVASNGAEGLAAFTDGAWDLVLSDCHMPVMDGFEMVERIRQLEAAQGRPPTPIVAITANATADAESQCLTSGMDAFLTKPVTVAKLGEAVSRWPG